MKLFKTLNSDGLVVIFCSVLQNISESIVALVTKEGMFLSTLPFNLLQRLAI